MATSGSNGNAEAPDALIRVEDITGSDKAAQFLDVNLLGEGDWIEAVGRPSIFRIPKFRDKYYGLRRDILEGDHSALESLPHRIENEDDFLTAFLREGRSIAVTLRSQAKLRWNDTDYGPKQVNIALQDGLMRLDKAVITALALNSLSQAFNLQHKWSLGRHEVAACVFYFANLFGRLRKIALDREEDDSDPNEGTKDEREARDKARVESVLEELADATGQKVPVLRQLAGKMPEDDSMLGHQEAASHLASFPTLYAILGFIVHNQPSVKRPKLRETIVRRRAHGRKMAAIADEVIEQAARVTHGPYKWDGPAVDEHWPPRVCIDPPAAPAS